MIKQVKNLAILALGQLLLLAILIYFVAGVVGIYNRYSNNAPGESAAQSTLLNNGAVFSDVTTGAANGPAMVIVPAGNYVMGNRDTWKLISNDLPLHRVTIPRQLAVARTEISIAAFRQFIEAESYNIEPGCWHHDKHQDWLFHEDVSWDNPVYPQSTEDPVTCITWDDANAYIGWLSRETGFTYRLPSEAEFEYFLRAVNSPQDSAAAAPSNLCQFANAADRDSGMEYANQSCSDGAEYTAAGESYLPNTLGLHDIRGNLWEWTQDCWHIDYSGRYVYFLSRAPDDGTAWTSGNCDIRILRGGSWLSSLQNTAPHTRSYDLVDIRRSIYGFRVVRDL